MSVPSRYAITALLALLATPVGAEPLWRSPELQLDTRHQNVRGISSDTTQGHIVVRCSSEAADYCASSADTHEQTREEAETIGETLLEIREWFDETGLLPSTLHLRGDYERQVWLHEGYVDGTTRAQIRGGKRVSGARMQVGSVIFEDAMGRSDLAHEWYHTASAAGPDRRWRAEEEVDKLEEAIAEAVGLAFAFPDSNLIDAQEPLDLHKPFLDSPNPGYEKAPYLLFVGNKLDATHNIAHVRPIMDRLADDGHHGMSYLYHPSFGSAMFDRAFPEFVARMNQPEGDRYYGEVPSETWNAGVYGSFNTFSSDIEIPPNAATPLLIDTIEVSNLPVEPHERLAVAEVAIDNASAPVGTHLNLVYEHQVITDGTYRWLMPLEETNEGPFLRATNAGPEPAATQKREGTFEGSLSAMNFELPACMESGETRMIRASGASLDGVSNFELNTSAGSMDGLAFTAPEAPGEVDVTLTISSTITRGPTITPMQRPGVEVRLGTIQVVEEDGCAQLVCLEPGDSWQFAADNPALFGEPIAVDWRSDRGTIDADGTFIAPSQPGPVTVTATAVENEALTAQTTFQVGACCHYEIRVDGLLEGQEAVTWSSRDIPSTSAFGGDPIPRGITLQGVDWETGTFERATFGHMEGVLALEAAKGGGSELPSAFDIVHVRDDAVMYEYLPGRSEFPERIGYRLLWAGDDSPYQGLNIPVANWNPRPVPAQIEASGVPVDPDAPTLELDMHIQGPLLVGREVVNTADGSGQFAMAEAIVAEPILGSIRIRVDGIFRPDFDQRIPHPERDDVSQGMIIDWDLDGDVAWCGGSRWERLQHYQSPRP